MESEDITNKRNKIIILDTEEEIINFEYPNHIYSIKRLDNEKYKLEYD